MVRRAAIFVALLASSAALTAPALAGAAPAGATVTSTEAKVTVPIRCRMRGGRRNDLFRAKG